MDQKTPSEQKANQRRILFNMFFSEPHGGVWAWIQFLTFTAAIIGGALAAGHDFLARWGILLSGGFAIPWCESLAEVLPKKHWKLAGIARIAGWVYSIITLVIVILQRS